MENMKTLSLTLDKKCKYTFTKDKFPSVEELDVIQPRNSKLFLEQVLEAFPNLKKLFAEIPLSTKSTNPTEALFMALQGRTKLEELEIQMGSDMRGSQTVLNQFVCMSVVPEIPNLRVLEMGDVAVDGGLDSILMMPNLEKLYVQACLTCLNMEKMNTPDKDLKMKSLALKLKEECPYHYKGVDPEDVETFCKFIDKMPMLQELVIDPYFFEAYFQNVGQSAELIRRAVKVAISQKRKVVINDALQVEEKRDGPEDKDKKVETLVMHIYYEQKSIPSLRKVLEETFENCEITDVVKDAEK